MRRIENKGQLLAIIYREKDWIEGLNFITPDQLFIQVGSWWYNSGKKLASHKHNNFERKALRTHEMTYVKSGSMRVLLYDENQELLYVFPHTHYS